MSGPLVSVILPTRNRHRLVGGAVSSVLGQTFDDFELWVGDDASDPPVRAQDLADDPRLRLYRTDEHLGYDIRSRLLEGARGELVAFLDDDDLWLPAALSKRVQALVAAPGGVAGVECGYEMWHGADLEFVHVPLATRDNTRALLAHPVFVPSTTLLRRRALDTVGGFPPGRAGDWVLWLRLSQMFDITSIPDVLVRRTRSACEPHDQLEGYRRALSEIEPLLAALPAPERRRIRAVHGLDIGVILARLGERSLARRSFVDAWRLSPSNLRPLLHLIRTVVGEDAWQTVSGTRGRLGAIARRALGAPARTRVW